VRILPQNFLIARVACAFLQKQIDLIDKHQDYRCCPVLESET
jgi:hypothetical protein